MEKVKTYDVFFYDYACFFDEDCLSEFCSRHCRAVEITKEEAISYIKKYNGTNHSYFEGYKGGFVAVVCNETGERVYSERIR